MRETIFAFALLALAAPSFADVETERVSKTISFSPGGTVHVKSFSGRVTITATDRPEVVIEAVRRGDRQRLDEVKLDVRNSGSAVYIQANHREAAWSWFGRNNVVETDLDIKVPRRTDIEVSVFSAPVAIEGVEGSQDVHSFSSRLILQDVVGRIKAHSFSGSVDIKTKGWQDDQNIDVNTFSGSITLHVPESARGTVKFNSFSGRLTSDRPMTYWNRGRRTVTAELGSGGGGTLRLKTFSGSVRIDP